MGAYKVTFIADYFVLTTTVDVEDKKLIPATERGTIPDALFADEVIAYHANQLIKDEVGFEPLGHCFDVEIEEVSYA